MKKLFLMIAAAMLTASVNAQNTAITANKAGDNWYIGLNAGVATPMQKYKMGADEAGFLKGIAPNVGLRVGKNLTTVFGLAAEAQAYVMSKEDSKSLMGNKTIVNATNVSLLGTFNLSNLFGGYKGEPRAFELIALGGFGWEHTFGGLSKANGLTSKVALDFAFNLGQAKAWQVYIEPAAVFGLDEFGAGMKNALAMNNPQMKYDTRNGLLQLNVGVNYKFGTSNGTHNFAVAQLRDQAEIDGLNAQINGLRAENDAKNGQIANANNTINDLKKQLAECMARPTQTIVEKKEETTLQPIVIFRQGKTTVDAAGQASIEMVAKYMKNHKDSQVKILGYASPEGSKEVNDRIAQARAEAVKTVLVKKYKIAADRLVAEGQGATDKLSAENDFNRVAKFVDMSAQK